MSLFRPAAPERRAVDASRFPFDDMMDSRRTHAGESVTPDAAMRLSAVWRCVNLLAATVSGMPVDVYRDIKGQRSPVEQVPPIVDNPSRVVTAREWRYQAMVSLLLRGNAYGLILAKDSLGFPTMVEWLDPDSVGVHQPSAIHLPTYRVNGVETPASDIIHLRRFLMPGSAIGLSPIEYAAQGLGVALAAERFGGQWFADGAHPTAVLETDHTVSEEQAKSIKARVIAATKRNRQPLVLGQGIKLRPWQVSANEAQFLETHKASVNDIARWFGVPAEMIGGAAEGSSLTYATLEGRDLTLLKYTVDDYLKVFEDMWGSSLPKPVAARFNAGSLLRTDIKSRYEAHAIALAYHFRTIDEVRALEDLPPLNNGEQFPPATKVVNRDFKEQA